MEHKIKKLMGNNIKLKTQKELLDSMVEDNQKMGLYDEPDEGWDLIFNEIEGSLHSELPIRVKNWLRNKFYSPVKR
jgi:hypothetical protein